MATGPHHDEHEQTDAHTDTDRDAERDTDQRVPGVGDDERENREHLARTGEPQRDKFGNADGAS